jgi:hypothetical protein
VKDELQFLNNDLLSPAHQNRRLRQKVLRKSEKAILARLRQFRGKLSADIKQVLNEMANVARRRLAMSWLGEGPDNL